LTPSLLRSSRRNSLTDVVNRIEAELAAAGMITYESARKVRSLRVETEHLFNIQTGHSADAE
jgi:hypothetical protein